MAVGGPVLHSITLALKASNLWRGLDVVRHALGDGDTRRELVQLLVVPAWTRVKPWHGERDQRPDGELEVPWDDARLPVVAHGVAGQLEDLSGQVLHHGGHVDWGAGSHPTLLA